MTETDLDILASKIARLISAQPRWLGVQEATAYAKLGRGKLKRLIKEGAIRGYQDPDSSRGDWIVDRLSLDEYRMAPIEMSSAREKEILAEFEGLI
ncbi:MAG: hypothetical protein V1793_00155 [Pseudomonadota bacterium]